MAIANNLKSATAHFLGNIQQSTCNTFGNSCLCRIKSTSNQRFFLICHSSPAPKNGDRQIFSTLITSV
ncbi:MAG: hypothetical protein AAFQ80_16925 [Cyanobacteria bacterium J06621_8]